MTLIVDMWKCECGELNGIEDKFCHCNKEKPLAVTILPIEAHLPAALELLERNTSSAAKRGKSRQNSKKEAKQKEPKPKKKAPKISTLEWQFMALWEAGVFASPTPEYRFHPKRRWRFDFAWPLEKIAVECEGGTWSGGRHTRGKGYENDCEKYNEAVILGWRVLRFTKIDRNAIEKVETLFRQLEGMEKIA